MSQSSDDDRTVLVTGPAPVRSANHEPGGNAFAVGARLAEFEITGLLGEGGFGIVYLAWDSSLERQVALKEYMPSAFASRSATMGVAVKSARDTDTFQAGLRSFVNEARILAQFDHPSLIKVYRFWEANGTAYMVMPYYQGTTLKQTLLGRSEAPDEAWLKALLVPLLDTLDLIHQHQCFHRDIAPDNIMMLRSGRPLLLDFGAARRAVEGMQQAFTVIFKQNYAPIEQYAEMPGMQQGPWTDLYALASVIHFAITGTAPPPAVGRLVQDPYVPLASRPEESVQRFSPRFLKAIDHALAVRPEQRPQSAAELRTLLGLAEGPAQALAASSPAPAPAQTGPATPAVARAPAPRYLLVLAAGTVALLAAAGLALFVIKGKGAQQVVQESVPVAAPAAPAAAAPAAAAPAAVFDPLAALQQVVDGAGLDRAVAVSTGKAQVRIGKDRLSFAVRASHDGYLYVQMVGSDRNNFYLLFPNALDKKNFVRAGQTLTLPRVGWHLDAPGPAGTDHFVAMISDAPRNFDSAGLVPSDAFSAFPIARARTLARTYSGVTPLFAGTPACATADVNGAICSAVYGARAFTIEEIAP